MFTALLPCLALSLNGFQCVDDLTSLSGPWTPEDHKKGNVGSTVF